MNAINFTFAEFVDERWPLLQVAVRHLETTNVLKVEWLGEDYEVHHNYTQISRTPFVDRGRNKYMALISHLSGIEHTLWHGKPAYEVTSYTRTMCGGVLHYLGRQPTTADTIRLRPLTGRELDLLLDRDNGMSKFSTHEFLSEFSLMVVPGSGPGALPIEPNIYPIEAPKAWSQGEALFTK